MTFVAKRAHPYIPNSAPETKAQMMKEIGIQRIEELFADLPQQYRVKSHLDLPQKALSEFEVKKHVENLLNKNRTKDDIVAFVGAGCWPHYLPSVVTEIVRRSELATTYTPYQPEISQGMLQILFEYQSLICELIDMDVANCSMYDWASALGESARMASRIKSRNQILIPKIIHPERASVLRTYTEPIGITTETISYMTKDGNLDLDDLKAKISKQTAAVYIENPSYLGFIETQVDEIEQITHENGALLIVGVDPTSLGLVKPPGRYEADIVVGESQPLGNPMNFGGPSLGIMACKDEMNLIRQMPGRIIGMTTTLDGNEIGYCMTLQTREQHIRREKATSNICSNEALCAVASAVYLALLGPEGVLELGQSVLSKTLYAMTKLSRIDGVEAPVFRSPHFKEFTVNFDEAEVSVKEVNDRLLLMGIQGGKDISKEYAELGQTALYCVTETHSKEDIDRLGNAIESMIR